MVVGLKCLFDGNQLRKFIDAAILCH